MSLLLLGSLPQRSESAIAVVEVGAALTQQTITAVNQVIQTANWIIELTPFDELVLADSYREDLNMLAELANTAGGLAWEIGGLERQFDALFGIDTLPDTSLGYSLRRSEVAQLTRESLRYAMRTQTLISSTIRTVQHLMGFLDQIATALGNLSASQNISTATQKLAQLSSQSQMMDATMDRAKAMKDADELTSIESLKVINNKVWSSWPGRIPLE